MAHTYVLLLEWAQTSKKIGLGHFFGHRREFGCKAQRFHLESVDAVGIEPGSVRRDSPDSAEIAENVALAETLINPSEPDLEDHLRTRVPNVDALSDREWIRRVWGALRVV